MPTPATELSAGSIAARIEPTPGRTYELSILATDGSGKATQVARTTGVRLALDEEQGWNQSQPFVAFERTEHGIRLQCKPHGSHQISLDLVADPAGLKVNVRDSIGLRSRVRELAIDYQLVAAEQVEECWTPHLHPGNDSLAADQDFHLPLAFLRAGTAGLALAPTAESLSDRHRRMPQGLRVDPDLRRLRHGCFAITHRRDGARTLDELTDHGQEQRRIGRELQGETLEFGHLLIPFAAADAGTFDQTVAMLFSGMAAPWLRATAWPSSDSLLQLAARWRTAVAASMRTVQVGGTQITLLDDATGEPAPGEMTSCPLTWDRSSLGAAWTLLRQIPAAGNTGHDEAEKLVRTLLLAPRPGPMPPGRIVAAPAQQLFRSEPSPGGDYRLLDAGTTGCWLLRLAEELPVEHDRLLEQANELVPFLHANQGGAGGIPAYFTPEFLAPRRDRLFDGGAEGAGAAQFLVEHALATGQPASREAARAVLDLLAAVSHGSGWADSEIAVARTGLDPAQHPGQFVDG
ncbi:MAG TPA: hypothetical protein VK348_08600, partial [Planctomycetota bacterium]|nr:hypothetical protein [Planctomycetota bacterium]